MLYHIYLWWVFPPFFLTKIRRSEIINLDLWNNPGIDPEKCQHAVLWQLRCQCGIQSPTTKFNNLRKSIPGKVSDVGDGPADMGICWHCFMNILTSIIRTSRRTRTGWLRNRRRSIGTGGSSGGRSHCLRRSWVQGLIMLSSIIIIRLRTCYHVCIHHWTHRLRHRVHHWTHRLSHRVETLAKHACHQRVGTSKHGVRLPHHLTWCHGPASLGCARNNWHDAEQNSRAQETEIWETNVCGLCVCLFSMFFHCFSFIFIFTNLFSFFTAFEIFWNFWAPQKPCPIRTSYLETQATQTQRYFELYFFVCICFCLFPVVFVCFQLFLFVFICFVLFWSLRHSSVTRLPLD